MAGVVFGSINGAPLVIAAIVAVTSGVRSLRAWRKKWLVDDTPSSSCRGVFVGRNEVTGAAMPLDEALRTPFSQTPAVWFEWHLEQYHSGDHGGSWDTVERRATAAPFWLQDDTGRILVRPRGGSVEGMQTVQRQIGGDYAPPYNLWQLRQWVLVGEDLAERQRSLATDPRLLAVPHAKDGWFDFQGDTARPISALAGRNRITEHVVPAGAPLFVIGQGRPRADTAGLELVADGGELQITTRREEELAKATGRGALASGVACLVTSAIAVGGATAKNGGGIGWGWIVVVLGVELATAFVLFLARNYNRQVGVKEQAAKAWSMIDVSLRRRAELLPALAQVAEAYAGHERQIQETAVALRADHAVPVGPAADALPTDPVVASAEAADRGQRAAAVGARALAEAYPDLRADAVFVDLQRRIVDAEEAVASARTFYNDAIAVLRDRREQFPGSVFARLVDVPSWRLFEAEEAAIEVPRVDVAPQPAPPVDPTAGPPPGGSAF